MNIQQRLRLALLISMACMFATQSVATMAASVDSPMDQACHQKNHATDYPPPMFVAAHANTNDCTGEDGLPACAFAVKVPENFPDWIQKPTHVITGTCVAPVQNRPESVCKFDGCLLP